MAIDLTRRHVAGPSIAIVQQTIEWFGAPPTSANISKTAYLFTSTSLANGMGLFLWVPAITKFGRRPMYSKLERPVYMTDRQYEHRLEGGSAKPDLPFACISWYVKSSHSQSTSSVSSG